MHLLRDSMIKKLVPWPGLLATRSAWGLGLLSVLWAVAYGRLLESEMWCDESTRTIRRTSLVVFPGRTSAGWSSASFHYTCWTSLGQGLPRFDWGGRRVKRPSCLLYAPSFWAAGGRTGVIWTILVVRICGVYYLCVSLSCEKRLEVCQHCYGTMYGELELVFDEQLL